MDAVREIEQYLGSAGQILVILSILALVCVFEIAGSLYSRYRANNTQSTQHTQGTQSKLPKYHLIGLSGKFGVGKDTAAEWIREVHPEYQIVPFADALKRVVAIMTCTSYESQFTREGKAYVPPGYEYSVGKYQQILGQLGREKFREDIWVNIAVKHPAEYKIIPDVRHPNEADAIKAAGGIVIRINRSGVILNDGRDTTHISETALDKYPFENIIINDGSLEEFKKKILWML